MYKVDGLRFDPNVFINDILKALKIDCSNAHQTAFIKQKIALRVVDRIAVTILSKMNEDDIVAFETILDENPGFDETEALMMIAPRIEGLSVALQQAMQDLYRELSYDAQRIEEAIK